MARKRGVHLAFSDGSEKEVRLGAFSQIAAKRQLGVDALTAGDPEAVLFACWVELEGVPRKETVVAAFDAWLHTIDDFEVAEEDTPDDDDADPPPADPSEPLLDSPPTSD